MAVKWGSDLKPCPTLSKIIQFLYICESLSNFMQNWYFINNCLIKVFKPKYHFAHVKYIIVINHHSSHLVSMNQFLLNAYLPSKFYIFYFKINSVTQRSFFFHENALLLKKSNNPSAFFPKTTSTINSLILNENNFRCLRLNSM